MFTRPVMGSWLSEKSSFGIALLVKNHLRNHTNIVTVDKKSVSLYLHQEGYNDKDDDVLSFRSSWGIFAKFDLLEIIVNCLLMMMMMVMVMMMAMPLVSLTVMIMIMIFIIFIIFISWVQGHLGTRG